jgi:hypothetical protein
MAGDAQLMLWIAAVHVVGLLCVGVLLIPALRDNDATPQWRSDGENDDGWGPGPKSPPEPPAPPRGGVPLPDAEPARVRLRDADRLGDKLPGRQRRPSREPGPRPVRIPSRGSAVRYRRR